MFCKNCGKKIDVDSMFCSFCGAKQSNTLNHQIQSNDVNSKQESESTKKSHSPNLKQLDKSINNKRNEKYDTTYKLEIEATVFGIILLVTSFIIAFIQPIKFDDRESYMQFRSISMISALVLRIIVTVWVVNIAKRQNRETIGWGIFAFFLPSIALIVSSTRKKLLTNIQLIENLYVSKTNKTKSNLSNQSSTDEILSLNEWRKINPQKSINDYYIEINKSKKSDNNS